MAPRPRLVLHTIPHSHPCLAVSGALDRLGLEYEQVELVTGRHADEVERIYGEGRRTVPGLLVDEQPVHGTAAIFSRLDELFPEAGLYPEAVAGAVREAEAGLAQELQQTARFLIFGSLHFRPDAMGSFAGVALDPAGVDYTIKLLRATWKYIGITAVGVHEALQALPGQLDALDELIAAGVIGGEEPTAADFQIASSLRMLAQVGDVRPLLEGRAAAALALAWFDPGPADVAAGALPPGWVPAPVAP